MHLTTSATAKHAAHRIFLLLLLLGRAVGAQGDAWMSLASQTSANRVTVELRQGTPVVGTIRRVDPQRMVVDGPAGEVTVERADVLRVTRPRPKDVRGAMRRGFLWGAAAGGGVSLVTVKTNRPQWFLFMSAGWGAVGSLISGVSAAVDTPVEVLYRR